MPRELLVLLIRSAPLPPASRPIFACGASNRLPSLDIGLVCPDPKRGFLEEWTPEHRQNRQQPAYPRPPRERDQGEELDHGSRGPDADEQSRRGRRRGSAEAGGLWRNRPR